MLFNSKLREFSPKGKKTAVELASQNVLMAYPTYFNLPEPLATIGTITPYMKFFASTPKMMLYGLDQKPISSTAGILLANSVVPASYMFTGDDKKYEWYKDHGFIKFPFVDYSYFSGSLFPIWQNPFDSPFGTHILDYDFTADALSTLTTAKSYVPGTSIN
jgi:hypothetical protein